jgi:hypothetical protein
LRGKRGAEEVKSTESAVSREEKRDATAVSRWPFLVLTVTFIYREHRSPGRFAKISFGGGFAADGLPACQVYSRTRVRPSSSWISSGFHVGRWSKHSLEQSATLIETPLQAVHSQCG